jgi:type IV secretion system protein VirD4
MSATKILWGQILTVFLIVLTTTWGATQYVAWRLGFQAQLGAAMVRARGLADLLSAGVLLVVVLLRRLCARHLREGGFIAVSGGFVSIAVAIGMSVWRARESRRTSRPTAPRAGPRRTRC